MRRHSAPGLTIGDQLSTFTIHGRLLLGTELVPGAIVVDEGRIARIIPDPVTEPLPEPVLQADIVAPGLIDLQVNGGWGAEVGDDPEAIRKIAACLPQVGVTAFLPTLVTSPVDLYPRAYDALEAGRGSGGARPLGLHLEGPFLSTERAGAHHRDLIASADIAILDELLQDDILRLITVAPEWPGILPWISRLHSAGVVISLGHTDATFEVFEAAVDAGATMVTHLYNAMSPFHHRAPNVIGAALTDDRVTAALIADGIHCHPDSIELALRCKGFERIALVTDMVPATAMSPGKYRLGGQEVILGDDGVRLPDGTLAGSDLTLNLAVKNVARWTQATLAQAIRMASEIPARVLGLDHLGRLAVGRDADLAFFSDDLCPQGTFVRGECVYGGWKT